MKMTMSKKLYVFIASAVVIHFLFIYAKNPFSKTSAIEVETLPVATESFVGDTEVPVRTNVSLFDSLNLGKLGLSREAYNYAISGHKYLNSAGKLKNENILSIVDFSLASSKKRLFIIDLKNKKIIFNTYISHCINLVIDMSK